MGGRKLVWGKCSWLLIFLALLAMGGISACLGSSSDSDNGDGPQALEDQVQAFLDEKFGRHDANPCFAVGLVVAGEVEIGTACANQAERVVDADSRFQIGSISKPMLGIVTQAVRAEQDEPIDSRVQDWLREDVEVPDNRGVELNLTHLLTHTSGLARFPSPPLPISDWDDPYKDISPQVLLETLSGGFRVMPEPVGTRGYSNYGTMLLTVATTDRAGEDFGELLDRVIFTPANMADAGIDGTLIQGHTDDGNPTVPWQFHENVAGVGGVRASVTDMVSFIDINLKAANNPDLAAFWDAQQSQADFGPFRTGSLWYVYESWYDDEQVLVFHDGLVGGFTSFLAFEREGERGVVILADTFGLGADAGIYDDVMELAITLLDPDEQVGEPLAEVEPDRLAARDAFLDTARQLHTERHRVVPATSTTVPQLTASWPLDGSKLDRFPTELHLSATESLDVTRLHVGLIHLEQVHPDGRVTPIPLDQQALRLEPLDQNAHSFRLKLPGNFKSKVGEFRLSVRHQGLATNLAGQPLEDFSMRFTVGMKDED